MEGCRKGGAEAKWVAEEKAAAEVEECQRAAETEACQIMEEKATAARQQAILEAEARRQAKVGETVAEMDGGGQASHVQPLRDAGGRLFWNPSRLRC